MSAFSVGNSHLGFLLFGRLVSVNQFQKIQFKYKCSQTSLCRYFVVKYTKLVVHRDVYLEH